MFRTVLLCLLLAASLVGLAQSSTSPVAATGIKRTILQKSDLGDRDMIMGLAEIAPGAAAGRHYHHGTESGYVIEGSATLEIDGEPVRTLKPGDSYVIPAGKVHDARTVGDKPTRVLAFYVVEKGKPLAVPVP
jgi:quercetin dioxygenase-like cupin family protein